MDIRSSGVFGDKESGGGLYRGALHVVSDGANIKIPGAPAHIISQREVGVFFQDFMELADSAGYVLTVTTSGTATPQTNKTNGVFQLQSPTVLQGIKSWQWDDASVAHGGSYLETEDARIITYECLISCVSWTQQDWFVGLSEANTGLMVTTTGVISASSNYIGFHHLLGTGVTTLSANVDSTTDFVALGSGVTNSSVSPDVTLVNNQYTKFGIRILGSDHIEYYINETLVHAVDLDTTTTTLLAPIFCLTGGATTSKMRIDYVLTTQTR